MGLPKEQGRIPNMDVEELGARTVQGMEKRIRRENFENAYEEG